MRQPFFSVFFLFLVLFIGQAVAQDNNVLPKPIQGIQLFPDSIRVEFQDQNAIILFQFKRIKEDLAKIKAFPKQLNIIDSLIKESLPDLSVPKKINIVEHLDNIWEIQIENNPVVSQLRVKDGVLEELLPPGWEVSIQTTNSKIHIYIHHWEEIASLLKENFTEIANTIQLKMDKEFIGRKRIISRNIITDKTLAFNETKFQMPIDMLTLNASFAFGYFRNSFYPEITFNAMVIRNDHFNRPASQFGLIYENKFFTTSAENGFKAETNSFLSLGYSMNAYRLNDPFWIGIGGGLLVRNRGDYFTGNTAKFFITTGSKKFRLIPELYLTNDFKTFSLGGKLSYTF